MPLLDTAASHELLIRVVQALYAKRHTPVPGALVKAQLIIEATQIGASLSERDIGFKSFLDFVKTVPEVAVQIRSGSDMLLAPATAGDILSAYSDYIQLTWTILGIRAARAD